MEEQIECLCSFSSFSKSAKLDPSARDALRPTAPEANSIASTRVVLPLLPCPEINTLRMSPVVYAGMMRVLLVLARKAGARLRPNLRPAGSIRAAAGAEKQLRELANTRSVARQSYFDFARRR